MTDYTKLFTPSKRLKQRYIIATLSNGNTSLLINMAKFGGLPWDAVFSAETFHHYKPDAEAYVGAAGALGLKPDQVMMVEIGRAHV